MIIKKEWFGMMTPKVGNGPKPKQVIGLIYDCCVGSGGDRYVQAVKIIIYFSIIKNINTSDCFLLRF